MRSVIAGFALAGLAFITIGGPVAAQTLVNPDISAVGDMRTHFRTQKDADSLGVNPVNFVFHELELNFAGYLNPYMRADAYIGIHGTSDVAIHVEEASISVLRGLPWRLQFKTGKYLLDFGRINEQHPHQWSWIEWPAQNRSMLGPEGLWPVGAHLSTMQPIGETAVSLSANAFMSSYFDSHHDHGHEEEPEKETDIESPAGVMWSGRLAFFRSLGYYWHAELAFSGLTGSYDTGRALDVTMTDIDWKLRWRPDTYKSITWIGESMYSERQVLHDAIEGKETVTARGLFSALELQFRRTWIMGGYVDYSQSAEVQGAETRGAGGWIGYLPAEETARFTLVYRHETGDLYPFDNNEILFQIVWALGPHQPHGF
jgi:hypothetical protein